MTLILNILDLDDTGLGFTSNDLIQQAANVRTLSSSVHLHLQHRIIDRHASRAFELGIIRSRGRRVAQPAGNII